MPSSIITADDVIELIDLIAEEIEHAQVDSDLSAEAYGAAYEAKLLVVEAIRKAMGYWEERHAL